MADQGKGRKLIPPKTSRQRTIVYVVLAVVAAIIIIVVALLLVTSYSPSSGGQNVPSSGGYNTPSPTASNLTSKEVKVDTFSFTQNASSSETTFFVTVTNTGGSTLTRDVNVVVAHGTGVTPPNQPYPSRQRPLNNPSTSANFTTATFLPGETKTVPVVVVIPPGLAFDRGSVLITVT